ncbi:MAG: hypothetical protein ACK526_13995 [Planctomyces sp.]
MSEVFLRIVASSANDRHSRKDHPAAILSAVWASSDNGGEDRQRVSFSRTATGSGPTRSGYRSAVFINRARD